MTLSIVEIGGRKPMRAGILAIDADITKRFSKAGTDASMNRDLYQYRPPAAVTDRTSSV
jgi:hypothetical protein